MTWARGSRARRARTSGAHSSAGLAPTPPGTGKARSPERRGRRRQRTTLRSARPAAGPRAGREVSETCRSLEPRIAPQGRAARSRRLLRPPPLRGALEPRGPPAGRRCTSCMRVGPSARGGRWLPPSWTPGLPAVRRGAPAARHSLPDPSGGPSRTSRAWEAPPPAVLSEPESQIVLLAEFSGGSPVGSVKKKKGRRRRKVKYGGCVRQAVQGGLWMLALHLAVKSCQTLHPLWSATRDPAVTWTHVFCSSSP